MSTTMLTGPGMGINGGFAGSPCNARAQLQKLPVDYQLVIPMQASFYFAYPNYEPGCTLSDLSTESTYTTILNVSGQEINNGTASQPTISCSSGVSTIDVAGFGNVQVAGNGGTLKVVDTTSAAGFPWHYGQYNVAVNPGLSFSEPAGAFAIRIYLTNTAGTSLTNISSYCPGTFDTIQILGLVAFCFAVEVDYPATSSVAYPGPTAGFTVGPIITVSRVQ